MLILTVPSYQWLYNLHDKEVGHYRRYSAKKIKKILLDNNFDIKRISYFNTFLFPIALIGNLLQKISKKSLFKHKYSNAGFIGKIFYLILNLEKYFLKKLNFPFGLSLLVIATKAPK